MGIIELQGVEMEFSDRKVVNGLNLNVEKGEIFGLLGPNGAGKTTTLLMMSAQLPPTRGVLWFNQMEMTREYKKVKASIGVVPQDIALYSQLSGYENLHFFGSLYGIKRKKLKQRVSELLSLVGLSERANDLVSHYSGGMKRRINIAAALLHNPQVIFMDEPTVGIDPQSRLKIYELIEYLKEEGKTIVYTTHYMEEAANLCDRVAIIDRGKILTLDSVANILRQVGNGVIECELTSNQELERTVALLNSLSFIKEINTKSTKLSIIVNTDLQVALGTMMAILEMHHITLYGLVIMPPNLETVFLQMTGKALRD